jgi:hypothetical protein
LKAANGQGSSTASVNLSEAASDGYAAEEDATTLFDSNLSDVPVVYTVAGNKAVSIDTRSAIDIVPFGVACVASNELVSVKLSWSENSSKFTVDGLQFTDDGLQLTADNRLYVFDAVTGETTEVTDGQTVSVQPNDYGRYFLTTRGDLTAIREATAKGIVVSVRNKTVTVRSSEPLTTVRVMTTGGNVVNSLSNCGTEASIPMAIGGVYLVAGLVGTIFAAIGGQEAVDKLWADLGPRVYIGGVGMIAGLAAGTTGIVLLSVGNSNLKKLAKTCDAAGLGPQTGVQLAFGPTPSGVGLALRF